MFIFRCICPGSTWGSRCKFLTRSFKKDGFAWLDPLKPCFPLIISLKFLTTKSNGILLYSGPLADRSLSIVHNHQKSYWGYLNDLGFPYYATPVLALQIRSSSLELYVVGSVGQAQLKLRAEESYSFSDNRWHLVHIHIDDKVSF